MIVVHHTPHTGYESRHFSFFFFLITTSSKDDRSLQSSHEKAASGRWWLSQNLTALLSPSPTYRSQVLPSCALLWALSLKGCSQQPLRGPFLPWGGGALQPPAPTRVPRDGSLETRHQAENLAPT